MKNLFCADGAKKTKKYFSLREKYFFAIFSLLRKEKIHFSLLRKEKLSFIAKLHQTGGKIAENCKKIKNFFVCYWGRARFPKKNKKKRSRDNARPLWFLFFYFAGRLWWSRNSQKKVSKWGRPTRDLACRGDLDKICSGKMETSVGSNKIKKKDSPAARFFFFDFFPSSLYASMLLNLFFASQKINLIIFTILCYA